MEREGKRKSNGWKREGWGNCLSNKVGIRGPVANRRFSRLIEIVAKERDGYLIFQTGCRNMTYEVTLVSSDHDH